mgnify:CR=1 FL=1
MTEFGYALSSEEHAPNDLVRYAQQAEATGFSFAAISDHYHPWNDQQGQSPFVWSVIGALSESCRRFCTCDSSSRTVWSIASASVWSTTPWETSFEAHCSRTVGSERTTSYIRGWVKAGSSPSL